MVHDIDLKKTHTQHRKPKKIDQFKFHLSFVDLAITFYYFIRSNAPSRHWKIFQFLFKKEKKKLYISVNGMKCSRIIFPSGDITHTKCIAHTLYTPLKRNT